MLPQVRSGRMDTLESRNKYIANIPSHDARDEMTELANRGQQQDCFKLMTAASN